MVYLCHCFCSSDSWNILAKMNSPGSPDEDTPLSSSFYKILRTPIWHRFWQLSHFVSKTMYIPQQIIRSGYRVESTYSHVFLFNNNNHVNYTFRLLSCFLIFHSSFSHFVVLFSCYSTFDICLGSPRHVHIIIRSMRVRSRPNI